MSTRSEELVLYEVEVPERWTGTEHPRDGVEFEIAVDEPVGYASRVSFERCELGTGTPETGPVAQLAAERISRLAEAMTDGRIIDIAIARPAEVEGDEPEFRATVAYRHGPHLVTAFLWVVPLGLQGLVITALTDADMLAADTPVFDEIIASLQIGAEAPAATDIPEFEPDEPLSIRTPLPPAPNGWTDEPLDTPHLLRQLVMTGNHPIPARIFVLRVAAQTADPLDHHQAVLEDLASTMTDAELSDVAPDPLAIGSAIRSLVFFRQGTSTRTADVWSGEGDLSQPVIWALCDADDDHGRDQAVAWIRAASADELGIA